MTDITLLDGVQVRAHFLSAQRTVLPLSFLFLGYLQINVSAFDHLRCGMMILILSCRRSCVEQTGGRLSVLHAGRLSLQRALKRPTLSVLLTCD